MSGLTDALILATGLTVNKIMREFIFFRTVKSDAEFTRATHARSGETSPALSKRSISRNFSKPSESPPDLTLRSTRPS
jgi:hypothetical protein